MPSRNLRAIVLALSSAGLLTACVDPAPAKNVEAYHAPAANEPRAMVEIRTSYGSKPASSLDEQVVVDGKRATKTRLPANKGTSRTIAVAPGKGRAMKVRSEFGNPTTKIEKKTVTAFMPQYHPCGGLKRGMCREMVPVQKTIERAVTSYNPAAGCEATAAPDLAEGGKYVLEYDFKEANACELKCWKTLADGSRVPCDGEATAKAALPAPAAAKTSETAPSTAASASAPSAKLSPSK